MFRKFNLKLGDSVMIETNNAKHMGILIPRYEYADVNHLVLKLKNGYNIGINLEKIKSIKKTPGELDPTKSVIQNNMTEGDNAGDYQDS